MEYSEQFIRKREFDSYLEFCRQMGYSPEDYAVNSLEELEKANLNLAKEFKKIQFKTAIVEKSPEVLLEHNRDLITNLCSKIIDNIVLFKESDLDSSFVDWNNLKEKAALKGFRNGNWLINYLNSIPIQIVYDLLPEASVRFVGDKAKCIVVSNFLKTSIETTFSPIILNAIFDAFNKEFTTESPMPNIPEVDLNFASSIIVDVCSDLIKGKFRPNFVTKDLRRIIDTTGIASRWFFFKDYIVEFIILHEYAHVLLNHDPKGTSKSDEKSADFLAIRIMLDDSNVFNDAILKKKIPSDFYALRCLAPVVVMRIFCVFNGLMNWKESESHPHPLYRSIYLSIGIDEWSRLKFEEANGFYRFFLNTLNTIFYLVYDRLGLPNNMEHDLLKKNSSIK